MKHYKTILGIETSCDETAAAIYNCDQGMLSNALFSQTELHKNLGGVLPELASRTQLEKIIPIIQECITKAGITFEAIDAIAVTSKPGLAGSLLVGLCVAKSFAWMLQKPIIAVNHLEGHAFSACIEHEVPFKHLCITASGGHTALYTIEDFGNYSLLGETLDDAAGEAFDKIARLIGLPYPGGPAIERLAREVNFQDFFHYPRTNPNTFDFSFSGLKTAVLYDLVKRNAYDMQEKKFLRSNDYTFKQHVASSLLVCIADIFEQKIIRALTTIPDLKAVTFVGGVACNKYIKERLSASVRRFSVPFFTPSPQYCTDNAGMIAFVGAYKAKKGEFSDWDLDIFE